MECEKKNMDKTHPSRASKTNCVNMFYILFIRKSELKARYFVFECMNACSSVSSRATSSISHRYAQFNRLIGPETMAEKCAIKLSFLLW